MWPVIAMMGMSVLKSQQQKKQAAADRKRDAILMENSPYTKIDPNKLGRVQDPDVMGNLMQGAMMGAKFAQDNPSKDKPEESDMTTEELRKSYMSMPENN